MRKGYHEINFSILAEYDIYCHNLTVSAATVLAEAASASQKVNYIAHTLGV